MYFLPHFYTALWVAYICLKNYINISAGIKCRVEFPKQYLSLNHYYNQIGMFEIKYYGLAWPLDPNWWKYT